jgi:peroxiredoxin (alkyl hydroperoxide reductase subunit C)
MWRQTSPTIAKVKFPVASDPSGAVARAYGVYLEDEGLATRGRFIIGPDGVIRAVEILSPPVGRNTAELLRQLQAFQAVEANPGKAAQAGWRPGDELISTGLEYIGKY